MVKINQVYMDYGDFGISFIYFLKSIRNVYEFPDYIKTTDLEIEVVSNMGIPAMTCHFEKLYGQETMIHSIEISRTWIERMRQSDGTVPIPRYPTANEVNKLIREAFAKDQE